jgi:acetyltransferase-like isoleucine patch superfamily enzyme
LGDGVTIEAFSIIGVPKAYKDNSDLKLIIGNDALIRSHSVIYSGNVIGNKFQTGNKANIRELNSIGNEVSIGTLSVVEHHVTIGDNVRIHTQVFIPEYTVLEDNVWIGPNVVFTNAKYPNSPNAKKNLKGCHVHKNAIIGANSTILPGINIGSFSIVAAGSVVTKDVAPRSVVAGNPAKTINAFDNLPYDTKNIQ